MDLTLLSLLPLLVAVVLLAVAFRTHERFWMLGFMGWRKVYAGLGFYLASGLVSAIWFWVHSVAPESPGLPILQTGAIVGAALGVILVLAGSIERLRELSAERTRLEDVRAGFDLFDSLREIIAQPYAFLEVLDFALKEMVRAAGVESGGLWLYNAAKSEWVLTGWANMSEKLRQQTESVRGSGTGFDRLAVSHKARLFTGPAKLRPFFPEWEPEGFHSILGLPLSGQVSGSAGRQVLGVILLADSAPDRFDDDRARRLYAASDYVAAVIAEARITRQLDAARHQLDTACADLNRERDDAKRLKTDHEARLAEMEKAWDEERARLEETANARLAETSQRAADEIAALRLALETRLAAEAERTAQVRQRWEEARQSVAQLGQQMQSERTSWQERADQMRREWQNERDALRKREDEMTTAHQELVVASQRRIAELEHALAAEQKLASEHWQTLKTARDRITELEGLLADDRRAITDLQSRVSDREMEIEAVRRTLAELRAALQQAQVTIADRDSVLAAGRQAQHEMQNQHRAAIDAFEGRLRAMENQLNAEQQLAARHWEELEAARRSLAELTAQADAARREVVARQDEWDHERRTQQRALDEASQRLAAAQESERRGLADAAESQALVEKERRQAAEALAALEDQLQSERDRRQAAEGEASARRREWAEFEARCQREVTDERLSHRRRLHELEFRAAAMRDRLQRVMAQPDARSRLTMILRSASGRLPAPARLYVWQRSAAGDAQMIAWMDDGGHVHSGEPLAPWSVEAHTIPAEGVTCIVGAERWQEVQKAEPYAHVRDWMEHWGPAGAPRWAVCWPWKPVTQESTGWMTIFGFGDIAPAQEQIEDVELWAGFVAAAVEAAAPPPLDDRQSAAGDSVMALDDEWRVVQNVQSVPPVPETLEIDADHSMSSAITPVESPATPESSDLHNVIIDWAAGLTDDALRLNLTAHPSNCDVDGHWLRAALDRARVTCRMRDHLSGEFTVSTQRQNGHTILRLVRAGEPSPDDPTEIAAVEDSDLSSAPGDAVPQQAGTASFHGVPVTGRWLLRHGSRVGMELRFVTLAHAAPSVTEQTRDNEPPAEAHILVVDDESAMRDLIVGMTESLHYRTITARGIADAEARIASGAAEVVVINTTMTDNAGWDLARRIRRDSHAVATLLVIGAETVDVPDDVAGDWILRLPFQLEELQECLNAMLPLANEETAKTSE